MVNEEIKIISKTLSEGINENIEDYKNFHVGEFIEVPNQCGCFQRKSNWYTYETDEKNFCTISGPFNLKGIIYACSKLINKAAYFNEYKFSEEEMEIYINNHFHSFDEIDRYRN